MVFIVIVVLLPVVLAAVMEIPAMLFVLFRVMAVPFGIFAVVNTYVAEPVVPCVSAPV